MECGCWNGLEVHVGLCQLQYFYTLLFFIHIFGEKTTQKNLKNYCLEKMCNSLSAKCWSGQIHASEWASLAIWQLIFNEKKQFRLAYMLLSLCEKMGWKWYWVGKKCCIDALSYDFWGRFFLHISEGAFMPHFIYSHCIPSIYASLFFFENHSISTANIHSLSYSTG